MKTDTAAPAADIPGLVLRPYAGEADIPEIVRIQNAEWAADGTRGRVTVDEYAAWWSHPNDKFDPARDVAARRARRSGRGIRPVRLGRHDRRAARVPQRRGGRPGISAGAGSAACCSPTGSLPHARWTRPTRTSTGHACSACGSISATSRAPRSAERFGYEPARWFFDMERSIEGELPAIEPLPDGLELRPIVRRPGVGAVDRPTTRRSATTGAATTTRRRTSGAGGSRRSSTRPCTSRLGRRRDRRRGAERHLPRRRTRHSASGEAGWRACSRAGRGAAAGSPATSSCARSTSCGSGE